MAFTTLVIVSILCGITEKEFESHEFRHEDQLFHYRLFVPHPLETGRRYPLMIWLHGLGAAGDNNLSQIQEAGFWLDNADGSYFILMLQCPLEDPDWSFTNVKATIAVLSKIIEERSVDADRIYVAGLSSGGDGCWEMAMYCPELFAAVVPMASFGGDVSLAEKLINIPIWAFINECERKKGVEDMVNAVRNAGGNALLTVMQSPGHDSWTMPTQRGVIDWMLAQRRGALCWRPPGYYDSWQWWHILTLPCVILVFFRIGWFVEQRRRHKMLRAAPLSESEATETDFCFGPPLLEDDHHSQHFHVHQDVGAKII